ncbi:MAG: S41 family peptidase [Elusimicrobia bacterium]|nr:S41 family peptidase [Elusimicrobiota bacterium]
MQRDSRGLITKALTAVLAVSLTASVLPAAHASVDKTYEQLKLLVDILDYIKENYVTETKTQDLIYGAARGMVGTLDPFSQFMDPDEHKDIKTETEGQFGGLGIRVGMRDDWLTVVTPLPGTPAFKAGMLPQDRVVKIDGTSTKGFTMDDAVKKLRGKPGSHVYIGVARNMGTDDKPDWTAKDFDLVREVIKIQSVQSRMLEDSIGYVRITEFSANTADETNDALQNLKKAGATSLVLDLRNNPGGLLTAAVDVASFFIGSNQLIVYTQGRKPENRQDFRAPAKAAYGDLPMVVLVNGGSASGSEIVTGALQDDKRAVILGSRTYGKASVQSVIPLEDGSGLRLTVAHYYTPLGHMIMRDEKKKTGGITPDIVIPVDRGTESKLEAQQETIYQPGQQPESAVKPADQVEDAVLDRAVELLKARDVLAHLSAKDG